MSDSEHQDILSNQGVDDPVVSDPELEESLEIAMQLVPPPRVYRQGQSYLAKDPFLISPRNLLEVVTDRRLVENPIRQARLVLSRKQLCRLCRATDATQ